MRTNLSIALVGIVMVAISLIGATFAAKGMQAIKQVTQARTEIIQTLGQER